tara:strand:+ start:1727 stop:1957 length:231 start_codon:yes stop_codon:yes gene_type:complete
MKILKKMAKISMELLRAEQSAWKLLDNALNDANGKSISFGRYMNDKYKMNSDALKLEDNESMAMLMLLKSHVKEIK